MPAAIEGDLPAVLNRKIHIHLQCQISIQHRTDRPVSTRMIRIQMFAGISIGIGLGSCRQAHCRTCADTEMLAVIERHIHVSIGSDSRTQYRFITQIQIPHSHAYRGIIPLLQAMPPAGRQKLHTESSTRNHRSRAQPRGYFIIRKHEESSAGETIRQLVMRQRKDPHAGKEQYEEKTFFHFSAAKVRIFLHISKFFCTFVPKLCNLR